MKLTSGQRTQTHELLAKHKAVVTTLDAAFAVQRITTEGLTAVTNGIGRIGRLQAFIRSEHLRTHLEQTALLSTLQIEQYKARRGYVNYPFHTKIII